MLLALLPSAWALDPSAMLESAQAKMDAGDLPGAEALASQLLQEYPSSPKAPGAQLMLGRIKLKATPDATQDLLAAFFLVRTKYPQSPEATDALVHIGFLHTRCDTAQAISDFSSFMNEHPTHPDAARVSQSLGRLHLKTHDLDKAEASFDKAATISDAPTAVKDEAALQSGFVKIMRFYADRKPAHLTAAMESLSRMSSSGNAKVRARADLGIAECLLLLNKCTQARAKYQEAAQRYADQPYFKGTALFGMACCSQARGEYETAIKDYEAVLASQTGTSLAEKDAAWKRIALGSTSANAQALIQRDGSWGRLPGHDMVFEAVYNEAWCMSRLDQCSGATNLLTQLLGSLPEASELHARAAQLLSQCSSSAGGDK